MLASVVGTGSVRGRPPPGYPPTTTALAWVRRPTGWRREESHAHFTSLRPSFSIAPRLSSARQPPARSDKMRAARGLRKDPRAAAVARLKGLRSGAYFRKARCGPFARTDLTFFSCSVFVNCADSALSDMYGAAEDFDARSGELMEVRWPAKKKEQLRAFVRSFAVTLPSPPSQPPFPTHPPPSCRKSRPSPRPRGR